MSMARLSGKHALVTGGGSGTGAAIARALAEAGATVTICGRRLEALQSVASGNQMIHAVAADVTDETSLGNLHRHAQDARGPFQIIVSNAGMVESAPAHDTSLDLWQRTLSVNLTGAFLSVRPALRDMKRRGWGRIVFIASTAGLRGYSYVAPYVAAKHGVVGLARALAAEVAQTGVTVNAICPGFTETPMLEASIRRIEEKTGRTGAEARSVLAAANPQGRFIQPQQVAHAVLWLCDEESGPVTGQAISVSGGEV
jgi:NAD(P)-dependent dehydrogenase (short-subunit alcohol dehydrogenase family)